MEKQVYTLLNELYSGYFERMFSFEAKDETEAISKAKKWARYHSYGMNEVKVELATENEAKNCLHNEYVD